MVKIKKKTLLALIKNSIIVLFLVLLLFFLMIPFIYDISTPQAELNNKEFNQKIIVKTQLTQTDCLKMESTIMPRFEHFDAECKDFQIKECKDLDGLSSSSTASWCFYYLAYNYNDEKLCDYITSLKNHYFDLYWYCNARVSKNRDYCSYIEGQTLLRGCIDNTISN